MSEPMPRFSLIAIVLITTLVAVVALEFVAANQMQWSK